MDDARMGDATSQKQAGANDAGILSLATTSTCYMSPGSCFMLCIDVSAIYFRSPCLLYQLVQCPIPPEARMSFLGKANHL